MLKTYVKNFWKQTIANNANQYISNESLFSFIFILTSRRKTLRIVIVRKMLHVYQN